MIRIILKNVDILEEASHFSPILWIPVPTSLKKKVYRTAEAMKVPLDKGLHITMFTMTNHNMDFENRVAQIAKELQPMRIQLRGVEYFDNEKTVAYIGVDCDGLEQVVDRLASEARQLGVEPKLYETFKPHITIRNYMEQNSRLPENITNELNRILKGRSWTVDKFLISGTGIDRDFRLGNHI